MLFDRYIGIDYSGAQSPESRMKALQVYAAGRDGEPERVAPPASGVKNWTRQEIAQFCASVIEADDAAIIGIDHGFSFPMTYLRRNYLDSWDRFLDDFMRHWPTADPHTYVDFVRRDNPRCGKANELRLCEQWTAGAKSVFHFDVQGSVAKSTHAGLPWLLWLRQHPDAARRVHFWPFDGFEVPAGKTVLTEIYPALFKRRFARDGRSPDEQDAFAVAAWLQGMDRRGALPRYFAPPLSLPEKRQARLEGWILGVW